MSTYFAPRPLANIGWRYLRRHPWQSGLMVFGIILGVAMVVAIDLANASASRGFDLSTAAVAGRATHQITGIPQDIDESLYTSLQRAGLPIEMAPVVSAYATSPDLGGEPVQILGVDIFAEAPFRGYLDFGATAAQADLNWEALLTKPGTALLPAELAERHNLGDCNQAVTGCVIELEIEGQRQPVEVVGLFRPEDELERRAIQAMIITDIATAQEISGRLGRLDRIDLIIPEAGAQEIQARLQAMLSEDARMAPVSARQGTLQEMTAAFRLNLAALSMLALVVGLFLIYNTMTFSVVQRRALFGTLRALGVTRREIFVLVISEALLVGIIGAVGGVLFGLLLGQGAVRMVTQTINDLYFVLNVRGIQIAGSSLLKGALLGIAATLLTAAPPAWEAASVTPRAALSRSSLEGKARRAIRLVTSLGLGMLGAGTVVLFIPSPNLLLSFGGTFLVILGMAMLAPLTTTYLMRAAALPFGALGGTLGRLAPRTVTRTLSRTAVAIAALMVAISVTIGVSLMVSSFRYTVIAWLEQTLQGDIYISVPSPTATTSRGRLEAGVIETLRSWPGVERIDVLRSVSIDTLHGPVQIAATDNPTLGEERLFRHLAVPNAEVERYLNRGAIIVSEPYANRVNLPRQEAVVTLPTVGGSTDFPVIGVFYDYASTQGTILMDLEVYQRNFADENITGAALRLSPGSDPDRVAQELRTVLTPIQGLNIRPNRVLRQEVLAVFDRTFAITGALQMLATIVAFIGILSALLSLELERQREMGVLRAIGLTIRQLWVLTFLETGLMGAASGILAMPAGYVLAVILIYIINRRSFGWTLQMQVLAEPFWQALLVAVLAAMIAGLYPARRISRILASEALRSE